VQASKLKPNWNSLKGWRREVDFLAGGFWQNAMAERNYRRRGLGTALVAIIVMLAGLGLYIRKIES